MVRVETVLETWRTIRSDSAQAVLDWPEEAMTFRATPELMTFGQIARHILDSGHSLTSLLLEGETNFQAPDFRARLEKNLTGVLDDAAPAEMAAALTRMLDGRLEELRGQPAEWWDARVTKWDGQVLTRLEYIQFCKEHELTHRSQLFLYLRLKGTVPPTTRRRQAKK